MGSKLQSIDDANSELESIDDANAKLPPIEEAKKKYNNPIFHFEVGFFYIRLIIGTIK